MEPSRETTPTPVRASVIVPVFNGGAFIAQQLTALSAQVCPFDWELLVVDNGSTDDTREVVQSFASRVDRLRLLSEPRRGKAFALNAGRAASSGQALLTVDADDVVAPGYVAAMVSALDVFDVVRARADFTLLNPPWTVHEAWDDEHLTTFLGYLPYIPGGLLGVRAATWDRLGGFDTGLQADDVDFSWRAGLQGARLGLAPDALLHVRRPASPSEELRKSRGYGRSHVQLFVKFKPQGMPRRSLRSEVGHLWFGLRPLVRRDPHWRWHAAWHWGLVAGRLEGSLRCRTWYL